MIRLESVSLSYNKGMAAEVKALDDVCIELNQGQFVFVIGSNGSGKSTLLNLLAGDLLPEKGEIYYKNKILSRVPDYNRSRFIARIFQNPQLGTAPQMTLLENFRLAALRDSKRTLKLGLNKNFRKQVSAEVSKLGMGLESRLDQAMESFSGGQRQALSLLMATWCQADLLLMDEPTAALDPVSAGIVFNLAVSIAKEKKMTCVMVTHDLKYCLQAGDRIIQFSAGKILRDISGKEKEELKLAELAAWFV